jgi:hypothetical protein
LPEYFLPADPRKKSSPHPGSSKPEKTKNTLAAIKKFVVIQMTVRGALQMMALNFSQEIIKAAHCWLRTPPGDIPSEFITKIAVENAIRNNIAAFAKNTITRVILEKCENSKEYYNVNKAA